MKTLKKLVILVVLALSCSSLYAQVSSHNIYLPDDNLIYNANNVGAESSSETTSHIYLGSSLIIMVSDELYKKYNEELSASIDSEDQGSLEILMQRMVSEFPLEDCFDIADLIFEKKDSYQIMLHCNDILEAMGGTENLFYLSIANLLSRYKRLSSQTRYGKIKG